MKCQEKRGFEPPRKLVIHYQCEGCCSGQLLADGSNTKNTLTFLVCSVCKCCYTTDTTLEYQNSGSGT